MAADWQRIELTREQIGGGELERIRAQFAVFCMSGGADDDIAVFTRRSRAGGSEVYFSPAALPCAEFVFERHAAGACNRPPLLGTTLLVGRHDAVARLLGRSPSVQALRKAGEAPAAVDTAFLKGSTPDKSAD